MSTYYAGLLADIGILLLGALSVYIILATGQLSLGNAAFMAIGAYVASYVSVQATLPVTLAVLAAAIVCGAMGVVAGFPALRLKGIYLAMATLGLGEMVRSDTSMRPMPSSWRTKSCPWVASLREPMCQRISSREGFPSERKGRISISRGNSRTSARCRA